MSQPFVPITLTWSFSVGGCPTELIDHSAKRLVVLKLVQNMLYVKTIQLFFEWAIAVSFFYFQLFVNFVNQLNCEKEDLNLGPQDGRHKRYKGASYVGPQQMRRSCLK